MLSASPHHHLMVRERQKEDLPFVVGSLILNGFTLQGELKELLPDSPESTPSLLHTRKGVSSIQEMPTSGSAPRL